MADQDEPTPAPVGGDAPHLADRPSPWPTPAHIYVVVAGLILGVLAGPAVLGRVAPGVYLKFIAGGHEAQLALDEFEASAQVTRAKLVDTDVSPVAITEFDQGLARQREAMVAQVMFEQAQHAKGMQSLPLAALFALIVVMVAEACLTPSRSARARLTALRYILVAAALLFVLITPQVMNPLLVAVGVAVGLLLLLVASWPRSSDKARLS